MEFTTILIAIAGSLGSLANQQLNERKAQECPIIAKGKGYVYYAIAQDVGTALVYLEPQTGKMRKIFAPTITEYHDPFRGMPIHYRTTTTLSALAVDEQRLYLLLDAKREDMVRLRSGGPAWSKIQLNADGTPKVPDKGPLVLTKSGLLIKNGSGTSELRIYWRQDGSLIHAGATSGGEYLIDGKSIKMQKSP